MVVLRNNVLFTGNTAPYHITQPSTDNDVQIVSPTATMTSITCSLNITIPSTVIVIWSHKATSIMINIEQHSYQLYNHVATIHKNCSF